MPEITKQDALRWLEMQRDAINTEIAYAAPDDKRQHFGNLKVVNWLTDRVNEMTAVEFIETTGEMLLESPMKAWEVMRIKYDHPRRAVEIVKRWKEEQDE